MIVYMARNTINGKAYIGQTIKSLRHRSLEHKHSAGKHNRPFSRAIKKYGYGAFEWEVLAKASSLDELNRLEMHFIELNRTKVPHGYNVTAGGFGSSNRIVSRATREKMSRSHLGQKLSQEIKGKISIAKSNPPIETRMKMSAAWTEERKRANSIATKKRWDTRKELLGEKARTAPLNPIAGQRVSPQVAFVEVA